MPNSYGFWQMFAQGNVVIIGNAPEATCSCDSDGPHRLGLRFHPRLT